MRGHRAVVGVVAMLALVASVPGTLAEGEEGCSSVTVDTIVHSSTTVCTGDDEAPTVPDPGDPTVPDPGGPSTPDVVDTVLDAVPDLGPQLDQVEQRAHSEANATTEGCEGAWRTGLQLDQSGNRTYLCVELEYGHPGRTLWDGVHTPEPGVCPEDDGFGWTVHEPSTGTVAGICVIFDFRIPTRNFDEVDIDLEDCEFERVPDGNDPRVQIGNGGVVLCASVFTDPGAAPSADVDIEACPGGEDPAVQVGDWRVAVCLQAGVRE